MAVVVVGCGSDGLAPNLVQLVVVVGALWWGWLGGQVEGVADRIVPGISHILLAHPW